MGENADSFSSKAAIFSISCGVAPSDLVGERLLIL